MSDMYMYVCMHACMYQELLKKPQQIPRVFAHTWRIKLILILILCSFNQRRVQVTAPGFSQGVFSSFQSPAGVWVPLSPLDCLAGV